MDRDEEKQVGMTPMSPRHGEEIRADRGLREPTLDELAHDVRSTQFHRDNLANEHKLLGRLLARTRTDLKIAQDQYEVACERFEKAAQSATNKEE